jgi:hypothetical protein
MENIPILVSVIFIIMTLASVAVFYRATSNSKTFLFLVIAWMIIQGIIGLTGFYKVTTGLPPRFLLIIGPPVILIAVLFFTRKGRAFIDNTNMKWLIAISIIRIPVEGMLYFLFLKKTIPQIMTFEGWNFDVVSGLTACFALIVYFSRLPRKQTILLAWNFICLALLINIVVIAILSAPFAFQKLAFDQPNIAVLYFPFLYLPAVIVPFVLFSHLASIRQLIIGKQNQKSPSETRRFESHLPSTTSPSVS